MNIKYLFLIAFLNICFKSEAQLLIIDTTEFRNKLNNLNIENEKFNQVCCYNKFPLFIKNGLKEIGKTKFKIADPNGEYNSTDDIKNSRLPYRKLIYANMSDNYFIFSYFKNEGAATGMRCIIIRFTKEKKISWVLSFRPPIVHTLEELIKFIRFKRDIFYPQINI